MVLMLLTDWLCAGSVIAFEVVVADGTANSNEAAGTCPVDPASVTLKVFYNHQPLEFRLPGGGDSTVTVMTLQQLWDFFQ
jgi:hypothetical protein